jgi:2,4-dienoyl-CoA reductase-like NADH-dependent reductase (Old Yellow Enzyme family)
VSKEGKGSIGQIGIYDDTCIKELFEITRYIHKHTESKIFAQLIHCGIQGSQKIAGYPLKGPNEMVHTDIEQLVDDFAQAAMRAKAAGFDGVQIHAAHGYLLSEFLSPFFNNRDDAYGQTNKQRVQIVVDILDHVRKKVGSKYPILLKLNSDDYLDDGLNNEDCLEMLQYLDKTSVDCIEISGGTMSSKPSPVRSGDPKTEDDQWYYREFARTLKSKFAIPLIAMGGIRDVAVAEKILENNEADLIGLSRPLICEPDIIKRWKDGDVSRVKCISCNKCFRPLLVGKGLSCVQFKA